MRVHAGIINSTGSQVLGHFSYSLIPPVENGPFRLDFFSTGFFWSFSYRQSSRFYSFCALTRGGWCEGVLLYHTAGDIGWQLCASRFLREQRLDEPSSQRVGGFGLSRKPPKLRSWSCTQPRAAKATAGAAVVSSMGLSFSTDPVEKVEFFDWICQSVGILSRKKLSRKSPFSTV